MATAHPPEAPVPSSAWEAWTPDYSGLQALRRWRRPRRLWLTLDPEGLAEAQLRALLDTVAGANSHTVALVTTHPHPLVRAATGYFFRHDGSPLPERVLPTAVVTGRRGEGFFATTQPLLFAPAQVRGLLLRTTQLEVPLVASVLSAAGGDGFARIFLERETAAALPGWATALGEACRAAGAVLETVPGAVLDGTPTRSWRKAG